MKKFLAGMTMAAAVVMTGASVKAVPLDQAKLDISGIAQIGYAWSEQLGFDDELDTNRLRLRLKAQPAEHIAFVSQLELTNNVSSAYAPGGTSTAFGANVPANAVLNDGFGADSRIVDLYMVLTYLDWATILVGQMPTPVSYELNTDEYSLETINYSQFVGIANRDRGIGVVAPLTDRTQLITWLLNGVGGISGVTNDVDDRDNYGVMLNFNAMERLNVKAFGNFGNYLDLPGNLGQPATDKAEMDVDAWGGGFNYSLKGFHMFSEFVQARISMDNETTSTRLGSQETREWFVNGSYVFPDTNLQLVLRYDRYDPDTDTDSDESKITTVGLNWDFEKNARVQLMREFKSGPVNVLGRDPEDDKTMLQLSVRF